MIFSKVRKYQLLFLVFILVALTLPTFWRMLKPGLFSMQDWHIFRLFEYNKCIMDGQIPCRWAPDVAFEYGEPVFNFYGQFIYTVGEVFKFLGFSLIDSLKGVFIVSLVTSALSMFVLGKQLWKNNWAALVSAVVYTYAPYRAVDIFVRGALPEAFAFVFIPLVIYFFNEYVLLKKTISLLFFSLSFALLVLTHNLSAFMFMPFFTVWAVYYLWLNKAWGTIPKFLLAGLLSAGLASFYLWPVIFESQYVTLETMTEGFFYYVANFATVNQLLISRFWGYGSSVWGANGMSLSVGQLQWVLPLLILLFIFIRRSWKANSHFLVLFVLGWIALFFTHNKSTFIWQAIAPMKYIQFPWRFLEFAVFTFSLSAGTSVLFFKSKLQQGMVAVLIIVTAIALNAGFFHEDIWYNVTDAQEFSGNMYNQEMIAASIHDYWPVFGKNTPAKKSDHNLVFKEGSGSAQLLNRNSDSAAYEVNVVSKTATVEAPIAYFPGWTTFFGDQAIKTYPSGELGLITFQLPAGPQKINIKFENTPVREAGNIISLVSLIGFAGLLVLVKMKKL